MAVVTKQIEQEEIRITFGKRFVLFSQNHLNECSKCIDDKLKKNVDPISTVMFSMFINSPGI